MCWKCFQGWCDQASHAPSTIEIWCLRWTWLDYVYRKTVIHLRRIMVTLFIWIIPSMVLHLKWMVYWISIVVIHMFMPKDINDSTTYLWHCHVSHIGIKRMKKLHVYGSLDSLIFWKVWDRFCKRACFFASFSVRLMMALSIKFFKPVCK